MELKSLGGERVDRSWPVRFVGCGEYASERGCDGLGASGIETEDTERSEKQGGTGEQMDVDAVPFVIGQLLRRHSSSLIFSQDQPIPGSSFG